MRLIRLIVFSVITLFLLVSFIGLLFPSQVTVMRSATFGAPRDTVYKLLSDTRYWGDWMFSRAHHVEALTATTSGKGAAVRVGTNEITIQEADSTSVESVWKTPDGKKQLCIFRILPGIKDPGIEVQWYFRQHLKWYPWERIGAVLNEKILGPSMDSSFARLQKRLY